jgi:HAD superfamily hydrolase (TIGR01549 family)
MRERSDIRSGDGSRDMLAAIIWDYDGTLVDTQRKNLSVTRAIIKELTGADPTTFPALQSPEMYAHAMRQSTNWRDFYGKQFGLTDAEVDNAGKRWTEFQMRDETPVPLFEGIRAVLSQLQHLPHAIVSQNARAAIEHTLEQNAVRHHFNFIVGFEEVELRRQKPEPDGILHCIDSLTGSKGGQILYIGDHESDAALAHHANQILRNTGSRTRIRSVAALYSVAQETALWRIKPDYDAQETRDIVNIVESINNLAATRQ